MGSLDARIRGLLLRSPRPPAVVPARRPRTRFGEGRGGGSGIAGAALPSRPSLPVPCPRGPQTGSALLVGPRLGTGRGQRPRGSVLLRPAGPFGPLPARTRGEPRPGRTRLVLSFFSDRNGVIVGDGKLRRVPTMGTLSCRAVWVAGCAGWRGQSEPRRGASRVRRSDLASPPPPVQRVSVALTGCLLFPLQVQVNLVFRGHRSPGIIMKVRLPTENEPLGL